MNYNYSLTTPDTTHLSEKGSLQVSDFVEVVKTEFNTIKEGELAKQRIVKVYLELEKELTDGAETLISNIMNTLGISKGYVSQVRGATKFVDSLGNDIHSKKLKSFVEEHPLTTQYEMRKLDKDTIGNKMLTGKRFTRREVENFTRVDTIPNPAPMPTVSLVDAKQQKAQELINDPSKEWINSLGSAVCYQASSSDLIRAAIQVVQEMSVCSGAMDNALMILSKECTAAIARSRVKKEKAEQQTKLK